MPNKFLSPSVVVIVDVWHDTARVAPPAITEHLLKLIREDFVKCIVVASYTTQDIHGTHARPIEWPIWHNSRRIFNPDLNPAVPDYIGRSWQSFEHAQVPPPPAMELMAQFVSLDRPVTDQTLLEELARIATPSFAVWKPDQLAYLLNEHYPEIENIYLCGGAFEHCLQDRPLGIQSLQHELRRGVYKNIQRLLIPVRCVFNGHDMLFEDEVKLRPQLLNPNWNYIQDQQLLIVQERTKRESTISAAVQSAIQQPTSSAIIIDAEHLQAVEAARLDSQRRRGLL